MKSLAELKKLLKILPESSPIYVIGGLALDGHFGKITRRHDDVDLICWRKDLPTVTRALNKIGYNIKTYTLKEEPKFEYYITTTDKRNIITINVIDKKPNNKFEISYTHFPHKLYPVKLLGPYVVRLRDVIFTAVSFKLLKKLNNNRTKFLTKLKKSDPKLYKRLGYKVDNYFHDVKLINKLGQKIGI